MAKLTMGDIAKLSPEKKELWRLHQLLKAMTDTAKAADDGNWQRNHSVVTSFHKATETKSAREVSIALAEFDTGSLKGSMFESWMKHTPPVHFLKNMPNSRHIVATQPKMILRLAERIYAAIPELKEFD